MFHHHEGLILPCNYCSLLKLRGREKVFESKLCKPQVNPHAYTFQNVIFTPLGEKTTFKRGRNMTF